MLLDLCGAIASLLSTYYFIRLDSKAWLFTLISTWLNGYLYWQQGIYADTCLELFYFLSTCYGWHLWNTPLKNNEALIHYLSIKQWLIFSLVLLCLYLFIVTLLEHFTQSNVATLDALTTSLSLAAQWLMCRRNIATWIVWFITDALYAYMYLSKELSFHVLLMLAYTGLAVIGYLTWYKSSFAGAKH